LPNLPPSTVHVRLSLPVTILRVVAYWSKLVKALLSEFLSKREKNVAKGLLLAQGGVHL